MTLAGLERTGRRHVQPGELPGVPDAPRRTIKQQTAEVRRQDLGIFEGPESLGLGRAPEPVARPRRQTTSPATALVNAGA